MRGFFDWLETKKYKLHVRVFLSKYRGYTFVRIAAATVCDRKRVT